MPGLFSYEICIVDCLFNIFICHLGPCDQFWAQSGGLCYVKMTKNGSKSSFLAPFDLVINGIFFICIFFIIFICYDAPCGDILTPFRGPICVKNSRNGFISTFLAPFDILSLRHCRETPALLACFTKICPF